MKIRKMKLHTFTDLLWSPSCESKRMKERNWIYRFCFYLNESNLQYEVVVPRSVESRSQLLCISRQVGNVWALGDNVKP